jgi:hypothetical protein
MQPTTSVSDQHPAWTTLPAAQPLIIVYKGLNAASSERIGFAHLSCYAVDEAPN